MSREPARLPVPSPCPLRWARNWTRPTHLDSTTCRVGALGSSAGRRQVRTRGLSTVPGPVWGWGGQAADFLEDGTRGGWGCPCGLTQTEFGFSNPKQGVWRLARPSTHHAAAPIPPQAKGPGIPCVPRRERGAEWQGLGLSRDRGPDRTEGCEPAGPSLAGRRAAPWAWVPAASHTQHRRRLRRGPGPWFSLFSFERGLP